MDKSAIRVAMSALVEKMNSIDSVGLICGFLTPKMEEDYKTCKKVYDALDKGLESILAAETMSKEKI